MRAMAGLEAKVTAKMMLSADGPHGGDDDHVEQQDGKGQDDVGKPHDELVDQPAPVPRDQAHQPADQQPAATAVGDSSRIAWLP